MLDRSTGIYNPPVDNTRDATTLYASDREVFLFLVDDHNPNRGQAPGRRIARPLLLRLLRLEFRGGGEDALHRQLLPARSLPEPQPLGRRGPPRDHDDLQEITIRHSKYAASCFAYEAAPALTRFAESSPAPFIEGIRAAQEKVVARNDDDRQDFLRKRGFSRAESARIVETVLAKEGRPPESVFDFVQGITAAARSKSQQDAMLAMEGKAKMLLEM